MNHVISHWGYAERVDIASVAQRGKFQYGAIGRAGVATWILRPNRGFVCHRELKRATGHKVLVPTEQ